MQRTYQFAEFSPTRAEGSVFDTLVAAGRRHRFADGVQLFHRGDVAHGFWLIETGHIMACRFGREGERILYVVMGPGDLIGDLACFGEVPQQVHAIAEGDVSAIWIDKSQMDGLLAQEPTLARWLLHSFANKLRRALDRIEGDQSLSAEARIARVLVDLAAREGPDLAMTQQELADLVGVSRVTAGQVLSRFANGALVRCGYGTISVVSAAGLNALTD